MKEAAVVAACLMLCGCLDPYYEGPTIIGGRSRNFSSGDPSVENQESGTSVRFDASCQWSLIGVIPYWGWIDPVEEQRAKLMSYAPASYTDIKEGQWSIHTWNFIFVFQSWCRELRLKFMGVPE